MFRLALVPDLLNAKLACDPNDLYPGVYAWSLKQMGTLFVLEKIREFRKGACCRLLEGGAGRNPFFYKKFYPSFDYSVLDEPKHFSDEQMDEASKRRPGATHHSGYLGDFLPSISDASFDCIFSVSVLEHVPVEKVQDVCADMYRALKPGGRILHSIDLFGNDRLTEYAATYERELSRAGFKGLDPQPQISCYPSTEAVLFEPLEIVANHYFRSPVAINDHSVTILVDAYK